MVDWREQERKRLAADIQGDEKAYQDGAVRRWKSNGRVIPPDVYKDAGLTCSAAHESAYRKETDAFLADYRKRMANHVPSAEEAFEMRAAFGPDVEVVNVLTGRRYRTSK
jgi:hypothetical protein